MCVCVSGLKVLYVLCVCVCVCVNGIVATLNDRCRVGSAGCIALSWERRMHSIELGAQDAYHCVGSAGCIA